jgi:CRISPR-associated protein Csm2
MSSDDMEKADSAYRRAVLLRPKLAYQARKERGRGVEELKEVLDPCLEQLQKANDPETRRRYFERFVDFFEAILAYHKSAGGN